ncbi:phage tail assembly protein T [Pseudomonas sp. 18175]|uniref:phage tail assembly protein T n=1 Tax=Pseudomonas sp. 18175 TaxID=3390056 RepID=UPI003D1F676A
MALALRLGKTLHELVGQLSAEELFLWQAYNRESPISDVRGDMQTAVLAAAIYQAQGVKVSAFDLIPKWSFGAQEQGALDDGEVQLQRCLASFDEDETDRATPQQP